MLLQMPHVGHCTEVQEGEGHLFPYGRFKRSAPMVPCVVAWLHSRITASDLALDSMLHAQGYLGEVLVEGVVKESTGNSLWSMTVLIMPSALHGMILTQRC